MANETVAEQYFLDLLAITLDDQMSTAIGAINTALGSTVLVNPGTYTVGIAAGYRVREDQRNAPLNKGPYMLIGIEGTNDYDDWLSIHTDVVIPLKLALVQHQSNTPSEADYKARYYCRAMETALRNSYKTCGAWFCGRVTTSIEMTGTDRNRRVSIVRADVKVRTTRGST